MLKFKSFVICVTDVGYHKLHAKTQKLLLSSQVQQYLFGLCVIFMLEYHFYERNIYCSKPNVNKILKAQTL